jgi:hypothetical protein
VRRQPTILDAAVETVDARDREEFGQFMAGRWPGLVRLAYGLTGDRWLAEDIVQGALPAVMLNGHNGDVLFGVDSGTPTIGKPAFLTHIPGRPGLGVAFVHRPSPTGPG